MIDGVILTAFKRFVGVELRLGRLTVLTGLNGSGKSTVIQSILLAHQASLSNSSAVPLTAEPGLDLGNGIDVLNYDAVTSEIMVELRQSEQVFNWKFEANPLSGRDLPYLKVSERPVEPPKPIGVAAEFVFLSAERLGPRMVHPTTAIDPALSLVGEDGRYVAQALALGERLEIPEARRNNGAGDIVTLGAQAEAWLSSLVGPTQLEAAIVPRTNITTLRIRTPGRMGEWMLPTNTGFGLSYCLPVIVAGLLVPAGGILIVDSPEAHLHPAAQSAMGHFIAKVAGSGVQVIVETHSDHVLNGIRKSIALHSSVASTDVEILFFGRDEEPIRVTISDSGALDSWPDGFFDQMDFDLRALTQLRRGSRHA